MHISNTVIFGMLLCKEAGLCHLMGIGFAGFLEDNRDIALTCPVLLCGKQDVTGKVGPYNSDWTKNTGFPLVMTDNAAHNTNGDNPRQVNREIQAFLNNLE